MLSSGSAQCPITRGRDVTVPNMISLIQALPIGNALRVHLNPPAGAERWRLLRKLADNFVDQDDPDAVVVLDSQTDRVVLDRDALANGTTYFYRPYSFADGTWQEHDTVAAAPEAVLADASVDVQLLVRERLEMGLQAEIDGDRITHEYNRIPVYTAPPVFEETRWPVVTVHLNNDARGESSLGMHIVPDEFDDAETDWTEFEGYLSAVNLLVVGWALNPDQRIALRQAIKRVVLGNLPVFDDVGMLNVEAQLSDAEDFASYSAPVYQAVCQISCLAPSAVSAAVDAIDDVTVTAEVA